MNIVAREAGDASAVHYALSEVIALHAILMGGAIGEMREGHLTEGVVFELPKIAEVESDAIADRPVVMLPFDGIGQRASLRMALDASVIGLHVVHARGIENVAARGMGDVLAARTVATFAADVPLNDLFRVNVVVDGVAAVARGAGGSLHVVRRIKRLPPIRSLGDKIRAPDMVGHVPL